MNDEHLQLRASPEPPASGSAGRLWQTPTVRVIALDCEITAYAPEGDDPLF